MLRNFRYILLFVKDLEKSVLFYRDIMGFTFVGFEAPHIAQFKFGETVIYVHHDGGDPKGEFHGLDAPYNELGSVERRGKGVLLGFGVDDVDQYYREVTERGVVAHHSPINQEWGDRDFSVRDPDGYEIWFSQPAQH